MNIYLVRHGAVPTIYNNVVIGQQNIPLSEKGVQDIARLGHWIQSSGIKIHKIYSSDLMRAKNSAIILSEILGYSQKIVFDEKLRELSSGVFEGRPKDRLKKFRRRYSDTEIAKPIRGESIMDLKKRVNLFFNGIVRKKATNCLLVTHYHPITSICYGASNIEAIIKKQNTLNPYRSSMTQIKYSYALNSFELRELKPDLNRMEKKDRFI